MVVAQSTKSRSWSAWRQCRAASCHFHTAAFVEGVHVQGHTSDSIPLLFQNFIQSEYELANSHSGHGFAQESAGYSAEASEARASNLLGWNATAAASSRPSQNSLSGVAADLVAIDASLVMLC